MGFKCKNSKNTHCSLFIFSLVKYFVSLNCNINCQNKCHTRAIHIALYRNDIKLIQYLVTLNVDLDQENIFLFAAQNSNIEVIKYLSSVIKKKRFMNVTSKEKTRY